MHTEAAGEFFGYLIQSSLQAAFLAFAVLGLVRVLGPILSPGWRCVLWGLVLLRLAWPFHLPTHFSLYNTTQWLGAFEWSQTCTQWFTRFFSLPFFGILWATVATVLLLRLMCCALYVAWKLRDTRPLDSWRAWWLLKECKEELGIHASIPVYCSSNIQSPCLMGVLTPRLVLPKNLTKNLSDDELRLVFFHELAHFRHRDTALNWVLAFVEIIHWFNPMVRLICNHLRDERENVCDATALEARPGSNKTYGEMLLRFLTEWSTPPRLPMASGILGDSGASDAVLRRFQSIEGFQTRKRAWIVGLSVALLIVLIGLTDAEAEESDGVGSPTRWQLVNSLRYR
jgi:bla regulator protein BlaR1